MKSEADIKRFLDSDFRPNARVITSSSALFDFDGNELIFHGKLGAIINEREDGYVGFSGVSIPIDYLKSNQLNFDFVEFTSDLDEPIISYQIIAVDGRVFGLDAPYKSSHISYNFTDFRESYRGRFSNLFYMGEDLKEFRIFLKRSKNMKKDQRIIDFSFKIQFSN